MGQLFFTKMHGLGNDFMVVDAIRQTYEPNVQQIREWGDRTTGIGFDQFLLIEPSSLPSCEFRYRIFNRDGSEVEQCGNGARCFARYVYERGLTSKKCFKVETQKRILTLSIEKNNWVKVNMGVPKIVQIHHPSSIQINDVERGILLEGTPFHISSVDLGNPHAVVQVQQLDNIPLDIWGPAIEKAPQFPEKTNVGFMQVLDTQHIRLRVHERGVGETLACGSGACAAVVVGILLGKLVSTVYVSFPRGKLQVIWEPPDGEISLLGPATFVFDGVLSD
ncbi:MAG: diaminopimelate epimerase [Neisseriaceae bacterium]